MRRRAALLLFLLLLPGGAQAHALDAYLQAALIAPGPARIEVSLRLVPGVAALPALLPVLDPDGDDILSPAEQRRYAAQLLSDVTLTADAKRLTPHLLSAVFPTVAAMRGGMGEIQIKFEAALPAGGAVRTLAFENRHQRAIAAYLVNSLTPADPGLRFLSQRRSPDQSFYEVRYGVSGGGTAPSHLAAFPAMFQLGLHHIAAGTDHLLFLLTLLLPAPLLARGGSWRGAAPIRASLGRMALVVTAFTAGHSLTLAAAALGLVPAGGAVIEALIAGGFGLIHGLAFAATLDRLALAGFNLGIEAMQLAVVAAVLPSLLLLRHPRAYGAYRIGGARAAGVAALGWLAQRTLSLPNPMEAILETAVPHAPWLALVMFLASLAAWFYRAVAQRAI